MSTAQRSSSISGREIRGMVYDPHNESYLYVIDRYNDKLVRWHVANDETSQFVGSDESGASESSLPASRQAQASFFAQS